MNTLWPTPDSLHPDATAHQREQYALATAGRVGIIDGNPGSGKTTLSAWAIAASFRQFGAADVAVCAPTGKAAVRITEAMGRHHLPIEAATIHRTLGVSRNGHDGKGWGFIHNERNPLPKRFVWVDEASMLSTKLAASLLSACAPGTHVMFIGDFAQLPPVEHGAPLRDMIRAGLPHGELTEVHRNGGDVLRICRDLKEGRPYRPSRYVDLANGMNAPHIECHKPAHAIAALAEYMTSAPAGIDRVWDCQVLAAVRKNSELAVPVLNERLQATLNPDGYRVDGGKFRIGDKVICNSNGVVSELRCPGDIAAGRSCRGVGAALAVTKDGKYECAVCGVGTPPGKLPGEFVANGEMGEAVRVTKEYVHVEMELPARTVRIAGELMKDWSLAYAETTHKSQGSQWPFVFAIADDGGGADRTTSWEHWRTSLSRMERVCTTIGKLSTIRQQCKKSALEGRKTFLVEKLRKVMEV